MNIWENYYVFQSMVISVVGLFFLLCSWVFTRYALSAPFSFSKLLYSTTIGSFLVFLAVVINKHYPLTFFTLIVPLLLCSAVVHTLIAVFDIYLQHKEHQNVLYFPKMFVLVLNYTFFSLLIVALVYLNNSFINNFISSLSEASVKIGILAVLYLVMHIKKCECLTVALVDQPSSGISDQVSQEK